MWDPPQAVTERAAATARRAEAAEAELSALRHELEGAHGRLEQSEEEHAAAAEQVLAGGLLCSTTDSLLPSNAADLLLEGAHAHAVPSGVQLEALKEAMRTLAADKDSALAQATAPLRHKLEAAETVRTVVMAVNRPKAASAFPQWHRQAGQLIAWVPL